MPVHTTLHILLLPHQSLHAMEVHLQDHVLAKAFYTKHDLRAMSDAQARLVLQKRYSPMQQLHIHAAVGTQAFKYSLLRVALRLESH